MLCSWREIMSSQCLFKSCISFSSGRTRLTAEGSDTLIAILDQMSGQAIRGINVIKQYHINISILYRAVNYHGGKGDLRCAEVGCCLSCGRENHSCHIFVMH